MRTIIMVKLVFCVLQVIILFSCLVSGEIDVRFDGFYVDKEGHRYNVHTCTAAGNIGDELSWYWIKGTTHAKLRAVSHTDTKSNKMNITLKLTLTKEYNNTRIFCVKTSSRGNSSWIESDQILVTFTKASVSDDSDAEPFVTVTPDTSPAFFDVNSTLTFVCTGSKPPDGKKLTWFIQGPGSITVYAKGQIYDNETNVNNLELCLKESYNGTVLYCAQSHIIYRLDDKGNFYNEAIDSTVRSKSITLIQRIKEDQNENRREDKDKDADNNRYGDKKPAGDPKGEESDVTDASNTEENKEDSERASSPLVYAIPIGVIALLLVLSAAVWLYRRRRAPVKTPGNEESIYAIPEVQYVTLDFQSATKDASTKVNAPIQETSPYAEIIGIYRPNNTRKPQ